MHARTRACNIVHRDEDVARYVMTSHRIHIHDILPRSTMEHRPARSTVCRGCLKLPLGLRSFPLGLMPGG